jgi:hypothetical protein
VGPPEDGARGDHEHQQDDHHSTPRVASAVSEAKRREFLLEILHVEEVRRCTKVRFPLGTPEDSVVYDSSDHLTNRAFCPQISPRDVQLAACFLVLTKEQGR